MKNSNFRTWVRNIWIENSEERNQYHQLPYPIEEYWKRYKYWLKREYKFQRKENERKS